jgi:hypothetical protein
LAIILALIRWSGAPGLPSLCPPRECYVGRRPTCSPGGDAPTSATSRAGGQPGRRCTPRQRACGCGRSAGALATRLAGRPGGQPGRAMHPRQRLGSSTASWPASGSSPGRLRLPPWPVVLPRPLSRAAALPPDVAPPATVPARARRPPTRAHQRAGQRSPATNAWCCARRRKATLHLAPAHEQNSGARLPSPMPLRPHSIRPRPGPG